MSTTNNLTQQQKLAKQRRETQIAQMNELYGNLSNFGTEEAKSEARKIRGTYNDAGHLPGWVYQGINIKFREAEDKVWQKIRAGSDKTGDKKIKTHTSIFTKESALAALELLTAQAKVLSTSFDREEGIASAKTFRAKWKSIRQKNS